MKYAFVLSGENISLAKQEVLALAASDEFKRDGNILIVNCRKFDFSRLAYCHEVIKLIFSCGKGRLEDSLSKVNWESHCKGTFCFRFKGNSRKEKKLAGTIWKSLKRPKVNLRNPDTKIEVVPGGKKLHCGTTLWENPKGFSSRATKHKPGFHPSSMNPKLARACVNLSAVRKGEKMLDPFCGAGSLLVEAALMKIKPIGNDLDPKMLRLAKKNLESYKVKAVLMEKDALKLKLKADAIATDLPYGKASSLHKANAGKLYNGFLKHAKQLLKKGGRLVMVVPSKAKVKHSLKKVAVIDHYVHHALTRRIYVLEK